MAGELLLVGLRAFKCQPTLPVFPKCTRIEAISKFDGSGLGRSGLFQPLTVFVQSRGVLGQDDQETRVQQNGCRRWALPRKFSSHSVAFGTSAQAAVPRLTIC